RGGRAQGREESLRVVPEGRRQGRCLRGIPPWPRVRERNRGREEPHRGAEVVQEGPVVHRRGKQGQGTRVPQVMPVAADAGLVSAEGPIATSGLFVGVLGDLAESMVKRDCGAKDASDVAPGFGGILDVVDSVIFAAPVAYWWLVGW